MTDDPITVQTLRGEIDRVTVIDIRKEPDDAQIPGSQRYDGEALIGWLPLSFEREQKLVVYCGSGNSCRRVAASLRERGFDAVALEGGYRAWREEDYPIEPLTEKRRV